MSDRLIEDLRAKAETKAENRRVAEFGPGGGNPGARASQHIEWIAADTLEAKDREIAELKAENEAMRAEAATLVQGYDYVPTDGKTTLILRTTLDAASVPLLAKPMMEACKNGGR